MEQKAKASIVFNKDDNDLAVFSTGFEVVLDKEMPYNSLVEEFVFLLESSYRNYWKKDLINSSKYINFVIDEDNYMSICLKSKSLILNQELFHNNPSPKTYWFLHGLEKAKLKIDR